MKKFGFVVRSFVLGLAVAVIMTGAVQADPRADAEKNFQNDADLARLEHLVYWTGLIEAYNTKTGHYPFQDKLTSDKPALVRILTHEQMKYSTPGSVQYREDMDNNVGGTRFQEFKMKDFVTELESKLGKTIDEKYDIQRAPAKSPVGYNYFATKDGYLFWVTCINCGVTKISTLLMDGYTPTINIASKGMVGKVTKARTRQDMVADPTFKEWQSTPYFKEGFVRKVEAGNLRDSKN